MEVPLLQELNISIVIFLIALMVRAIFAFLETSITALRLFKLKELAATTGKYEHLFIALEKNPHRVLITTLIISSFSDVIAAATATNIMEVIFQRLHLSTGLGFTFGVAIAGLMIIVFGEILPKNFARSRGERLFSSLIWIINVAYYALYPLTTVLIRLSDGFISCIAGSTKEDNSSEWVSSEREVRFLIDYIHSQGIMETEKTEMLRNIFDLGHIVVKDIMVPTTDIVSINITMPINKVLEIFKEHRFTRLPVYEDRTDNIVGIVHQKDIFAMLLDNKNVPLKELVRPIIFVPESMKIAQLLREFRQQQMHLAIVLNEHGSITGLITLEDVLEEIVGEISDEGEPATEKILPLQQGGWLVDARVPLEELSELLQIEFQSHDSVTLGGFLTELLQHLPKKGERVLYKKYYFQIQKASQKRVRQVLIFEEKKKEK